MNIELNSRLTSHVGVAFKVKQPKWAGDRPTRGTIAKLGVAINATSVGTASLSLTLDEVAVIDLNREDALNLGIRLIQLSERA